MYNPQKVIDVALSWEGYKEKASRENLEDKTANAGSKNFTIFADFMDKIPGWYNGKKQGVAWCCMFVHFCFIKAYLKDAAQKMLFLPKNSCGAGVKYCRNYFKAKKRLFDDPQPGDQIFFWPAVRINLTALQHTGLVYKVDETYVYTIEGNASNAVRKKKYNLKNILIAGYGRPDWGAGSVEPSYTATVSGLTKAQADALKAQYPEAVIA